MACPDTSLSTWTEAKGKRFVRDSWGLSWDAKHVVDGLQQKYSFHVHIQSPTGESSDVYSTDFVDGYHSFETGADSGYDTTRCDMHMQVFFRLGP